MMFNASVNAMAVDVQPVDGENHLLVTVDVGMVLPFSAPGSNQPLTVPNGQISFPITREAALRFGGKIQEQAEKLKPESNIEVASSLGDIEQTAQAIEGIKNGSGNQG